MKKTYYVYALVKSGTVVYVGCTTSLKQRRSQHKKDKDFDRLTVIKRTKTRAIAYQCESAIINFITLFGTQNLYNKSNIHLEYEKMYLRNEYK